MMSQIPKTYKFMMISRNNDSLKPKYSSTTQGEGLGEFNIAIQKYKENLTYIEHLVLNESK